MVVGRAVYAWRESIISQELSDPGAVVAFANRVRASVEPDCTGTCPMLWVTDCWGNPLVNRDNKRSAFWRTIRGVVGRLAIAEPKKDATWPSLLVWSNLYKVAPAERAGNPTGRLRTLQRSACVDLFRLELDTYRPSRLLLLTGRRWADPFMPPTARDDEARSPVREYIERSGTLSEVGTRYVVAAHPQGRDEKQWIDNVVGAFES
jgi:hypothetical protein